MKLFMEQFYDVLVIGSGIAGLSAAVEAATKGCHTAIVSSTHLFSGSSFYPGTWGFGLVGPTDQSDIQDMVSTIQKVGCEVADPALVQTFVSGINASIEHLEHMGCHPRKAVQSSQREYIPCFDHKHRNWNGLEGSQLRTAFTEQLAKCHVTVIEQCTLLELAKDNDHICGGVFARDGQLQYIGCKSLVLATGGYGSLFKYHLCTDDVCGLGQALALKAGCTLVNMEFMQMMPGFFSPARNTIFNEKTFRFATFCTPDQTPVFDQDEESLLDLRSTYGPYTCRLPSCRIDQKLYLESLKNETGVAVSYSDAARQNPPEFIRLYFDWLEQEKKVSVHDTVHIGIFSHAANGGIKIDSDGFTGVKGLYACGEVTGGMHGADRIGGLSTANGLVFGQRAGRAAANAACTCTDSHTPDVYDFSEWSIPDRSALRKELQDLMYRNAMIIRNETGLSTSLMMLHELLDSSPRVPDTDVSAITDSRIFEGQLLTASCMLKAALLRRESRGSHYREDYPNPDPNMAHPITLSLQDPSISVLLP